MALCQRCTALAQALRETRARRSPQSSFAAASLRWYTVTMEAHTPPLTLVVLAAGIGSRYGGLKQLDPVGPHGELIVDYSVYDSLRAGFGRVVFVIRREIEEQFRERVGANVEARCDTAYVMQSLTDVPDGTDIPVGRIKPWGTAHAVYACRHAVESPFAVINADDFYGRSAYQSLAAYLKREQGRDERYEYCMVGYPVENTLTEHGRVSRGICAIDENGCLLGIHERKHVERLGEGARYTEDGYTWTEVPAGTTVSMNLWGFAPSLFGELKPRFRQFLRAGAEQLKTAEFLMPEVVGAMVAEGKATVRVLRADDRWFGATYREDMPIVKQAVRDLIRQGLYPENLWHQAR